MVGFDISWVIAGLLLIPYLIWGVYALRQRFQAGFEFPPVIEGITLVGLIFFYVFQYHLLRAWLENDPAWLYLALIGLFISGVALYGHMAVSLSTHLVMEAISPQAPQIHQPNYHAGEALEQVGDYEGAAREYQTVAAMFPKDAKAAILAADNLVRIGQYEEAVAWFERGLDCFTTDVQALPTVYRLADLYQHRLDRPNATIEVLNEFVEKYPNSPHVAAVANRLKRLTSEAESELSLSSTPGTAPSPQPAVVETVAGEIQADEYATLPGVDEIVDEDVDEKGDTNIARET